MIAALLATVLAIIFMRALSKAVGPSHLRPVGANNPHVIPMDFSFDPRLEVWEVARATGNHFNDVFLRDREVDLLDAQILELQNENQLLRALAEQTQAKPKASVDGPPFKPEEPRRFAKYAGQPHITVPLTKAIAVLPPDQVLIDHKLFTGLPGLGKTLIAKIIGNELNIRAKALGYPGVRFFWSFAANLNKAELLDTFVREVQEAGGGVWFIDEIHVLDDKLQTKIYALMEDGLYPFEGDTTPTKLPPVTVLAATTDYGQLHPALKRRFGEQMMLRRIGREQILHLIRNRSFPIDPEAAGLLADRTHWSGAPWEAISLRREAEIFCRAAGRDTISVTDVTEVFTTYEIDEFGLRYEDRQVIKALFQRPRTRGKEQVFVCYGASESDICAVAGLDSDEYRETIKPRLLARGFLEIRQGYGQVLTTKAVAQYTSLKT